MAPSKAKGKKLSKLSPDDRVGDAARHTLDARLGDVEALLTDAVARGSGEVKPIHRLRVSTRRASAALRVFKGWIPKGTRKGVGDRLRRVRQTAGEARMCDVQLVQFRSLLGTTEAGLGTAVGVVMGRMVESRVHAGAEVRALGDDERCGSAALARAHASLLESIGGAKCKASKSKTRVGMTLGELASEELPLIIECMAEAGRADLEIVDNVHALRIVGKRVRYASEIFECCFDGVSHKELLARLTDFQDHLGEMNDLWEMTERVRLYSLDPGMEGEAARSLEGLRVELSSRFEVAHGSFLEWWGERGLEWILSGLEIPGCATTEHRIGGGMGGGGGASPERSGPPSSIIEGTARHSA